MDPIINNVSSQDRILTRPNTTKQRDFVTPWIITYGPGYKEAKSAARELNELLQYSDTWRSSTVPKILQVVPRRAPNLKGLIFRRKALALDGDQTTAQPCNSRRCQTCILIKNSSFLVCNNKTFKTLGGSCKSFNIIYCVQCKFCSKPYVGKTTEHLNLRMNGHRSKFYEVLRNGIFNYDDDDQILGAHLVDHHGVSTLGDFNASYNLFILAHVSPANLRTREQFYINKLRSLRPFGLNQCNSI